MHVTYNRKYFREVSRQLGLNVKTVCAIVTKHNDAGSVQDLSRSGRPKKTTVRQDRLLVRASLADRRITSSELRAKLDRYHNVSVSASTVRSRLLKSRAARLCGSEASVEAG